MATRRASITEKVTLTESYSVRVHRALPPEHEFYAVVGRVASEAAHLEHMLDLAIWEFFGADQIKAACLTSQMIGTGPRFKALIALCRSSGVGAAISKRANELMGQTAAIMEERNRLVHDAWYVEDPSGKIAQFRVLLRTDPPEFGTKDTDIKAVDKTLKELSKRRQETGALRSDIMTELAAIREGKKK